MPFVKLSPVHRKKHHDTMKLVARNLPAWQRGCCEEWGCAHARLASELVVTRLLDCRVIVAVAFVCGESVTLAGPLFEASSLQLSF